MDALTVIRLCLQPLRRLQPKTSFCRNNSEAPSPSATLEKLVEIVRRTGEIGIAKDGPFHVDIMVQRIL
jgi:hypothetical protein